MTVKEARVRLAKIEYHIGEDVADILKLSYPLLREFVELNFVPEACAHLVAANELSKYSSITGECTHIKSVEIRVLRLVSNWSNLVVFGPIEAQKFVMNYLCEEMGIQQDALNLLIESAGLCDLLTKLNYLYEEV